MNDSSLHNLKDSKMGSQSNFNLSDIDNVSVDSDDLDGVPFSNKSKSSHGSSRSFSELNLNFVDDEDDSEGWNGDIEIDLNQLQIEDEQKLEKRLQEIRKYTAIPLKEDLINNDELLNISVEEAINNFTNTLQLILTLSTSQDQDEENADPSQLLQEPNKFIMKNLPSLTYQDFIQRLQTKCKFNVPLYLSSTYLLQIMFLERSQDDGTLKLKLQLVHNGLHRLIIAIVRVSCKLLEDQLFSHEYFSKVCGITKKLLTQLELSLLLCLTRERLMITIRKLNSTVPILHELRQLCSQA